MPPFPLPSVRTPLLRFTSAARRVFGFPAAIPAFISGPSHNLQYHIRDFGGQFNKRAFMAAALLGSHRDNDVRVCRRKMRPGGWSFGF